MRKKKPFYMKSIGDLHIRADSGNDISIWYDGIPILIFVYFTTDYCLYTYSLDGISDLEMDGVDNI